VRQDCRGAPVRGFVTLFLNYLMNGEVSNKKIKGVLGEESGQAGDRKGRLRDGLKGRLCGQEGREGGACQL